MRDLASIVTISSIQKMYQKDRIVCVSFEENSYEAIMPCNITQGQLVAFIQEGSILPIKEEWEFLRKRCFSELYNGFIIKPMTMGKKENFNGTEGERVKSWGLAVPLNELPLDEKVISTFKAGDDITDLLQIRKYEPEEEALPKSGTSKRAFPKWVKFCLSHAATRWIGNIWKKCHRGESTNFPTNLISMSDETTVQNMKGVLTKHREDFVYITAKMEGQSFTVIPTFGKFLFWKRCSGAYVCSRKQAYPTNNDNLFWKMMKKYDIQNQMKKIYKKYKRAFIIQGEQVGPEIQKNIYNLKSNQWFVYTVKDYKTGKQLPLDEALDIMDLFGLEFVPILERNIRLGDVMPDVEAAVAYAEKASWVPGNYTLKNPVGSLWDDYFQHEGVVVRTMDYDKDKNVGASFKVKNLAYNQKGLDKIHLACVNFSK